LIAFNILLAWRKFRILLKDQGATGESSMSKFMDGPLLPASIFLFFAVIWIPVFFFADPASSKPESDYGCRYGQNYVE